MDRDLIFLRYYVDKIVYLHNLIGKMNTLTYDDVFFKQFMFRRILKHIEEELEIGIDNLTDSKLEEIKMFDKRFLRLGE